MKRPYLNPRLDGSARVSADSHPAGHLRAANLYACHEVMGATACRPFRVIHDRFRRAEIAPCPLFPESDAKSEPWHLSRRVTAVVAMTPATFCHDGCTVLPSNRLKERASWKPPRP